jgi:hypothetical protein
MEAVAMIQEKISKKAYERFVARGKKHGHALEDWILAEKEVLGSDLQIPKPQAKLKESPKRSVTGMKTPTYA